MKQHEKNEASVELSDASAAADQADQSPEENGAELTSDTGESSPARTGDDDREEVAGAAADAESSTAETEAEAKQPEKPKKSAGEVIAELRDSVEAMREQFNDMEKLVSVCKKKLVKEADAYRLEGMKPLLESLMLIHDLVFRHAQAMEAGDVSPDSFVLNLLQTIEAELAGENIEVIRPQPGDEPDLTVMKAIGTAKCPFYRKVDRVARVHSCGFAIRMEGSALILRKAEITIYRKQA